MMAAAYEPRELSSEEEAVAGDEVRRGPWTVEEDLLLVNYIAAHGEGRWNALARCAGLKRTGKSCRLRWLNYLRPDVRRGNMTAQEQLLILELHARWGNRWSKIAQHLPGRTDNEIKNYWRTRVQKHAKHLKCDVNSQQFKDLMRYLWMPRLLERIRSDDADLLSASYTTTGATASSSSASTVDGGAAQLLPPPLAVAESTNDDDCILISNAAASMYQSGAQAQVSSSSCLTTTQLPASWLPQYFDDQFGAAETSSCCWSESLPYFDMGMGLPDFDMWGSCADDPSWYTQI
ncbi:hypothetical protein GUJ93_ZPchr0013g34131 [Zizania palustris]|uniref:Uncharacterized protein n=1 Tax=Zizania palustris TaxID=103762 RepID=A0A8J5WZT0_ZIZPA|nr:hypothetical protein GUJ93_ZPchr0013g34131 [Zizania palustris]